MKKLVVIVPAFNEEKTISDTLKGLFSVKPGLSKLGYELIIHVINDGSTDATKKIASEHMEVLIINHKKNKGLGAAVRSGLLSASNINADIVVKYDADLQGHYNKLADINSELWKIEDDIRECERNKEFGGKFVDLARAVYFTNDKRSDVKKAINLLTGSGFIEEKSYEDYE